MNLFVLPQFCCFSVRFKSLVLLNPSASKLLTLTQKVLWHYGHSISWWCLTFWVSLSFTNFEIQRGNQILFCFRYKQSQKQLDFGGKTFHSITLVCFVVFPWVGIFISLNYVGHKTTLTLHSNWPNWTPEHHIWLFVLMLFDSSSFHDENVTKKLAWEAHGLPTTIHDKITNEKSREAHNAFKTTKSESFDQNSPHFVELSWENRGDCLFQQIVFWHALLKI